MEVHREVLKKSSRCCALSASNQEDLVLEDSELQPGWNLDLPLSSVPETMGAQRSKPWAGGVLSFHFFFICFL